MLFSKQPDTFLLDTETGPRAAWKRYHGSDETITRPRRTWQYGLEWFDNAVRTVFSVSKKDLLKAEEKWKRDRAKKKRAKKSA
jgi:hypothetical protein